MTILELLALANATGNLTVTYAVETAGVQTLRDARDQGFIRVTHGGLPVDLDQAIDAHDDNLHILVTGPGYHYLDNN